jgi:hypothetical protein
MKSVTASFCALLVAASTCAEEVSTAHTEGEIGMEQKLERVYDLYRKGDVVSLKKSETQVGVGIAYTTSNKEIFGLRQSGRSFSTQVIASRGIGAGMEVSVALPYMANSQRVETPDHVLSNITVSGIGDPTLRIIGALPTKEVSTTAIFAVTLPVGMKGLSRDEIHTSLGVSWSKVIRPAFVSGGLSWERDWKSDVNGLGYNAGVGFFLNHALSVGGEISGVIGIDPKKGTSRDQTTLGLKVAYQTTPDFGIVASVNFGVATDTPNVTVGVTSYWRF